MPIHHKWLQMQLKMVQKVLVYVERSMFNLGDRLPKVVDMIVAETLEGRIKLLKH
jgi:hypothetical protein